ncbi:MAG TPA: bacitracin ABC transporter ATP-binding protein [Bacteroidetes bacterium]|nr:bacitracin ABC transporter ATP-binding protein [Bacteroidota bacterium]
MSLPVIEIRDLHKRYGSFNAVNGLNLTVQQGDVYGFLGPNGAGKSTTIRMMMSLIAPSSGSIKIFGMDLDTHRTQILARIGAIVERPDFYNYLTARRNLELLGRLSGADVSRPAIMKVLGMVGLDTRSESKVKTFSHGMKQRLGIAQALLHSPDLIVLDEPTTGLDPHGMVDMRDLILELAADHKKTIFLSSHILPEVELTANRMVIINRGQAIIEGAVQDLLNAGRMKVTIETPDAATALSIIKASQLAQHVHSFTDAAVILMLEKSEIPHVAAMLSSAGVALQGIIPVRSLEEYFISLTREAA